MEDEFIDEEHVPLIDRYENNEDSVYQDAEETSFSQDGIIQQEATEAELRLLDHDPCFGIMSVRGAPLRTGIFFEYWRFMRF